MVCGRERSASRLPWTGKPDEERRPPERNLPTPALATGTHSHHEKQVRSALSHPIPDSSRHCVAMAKRPENGRERGANPSGVQVGHRKCVRLDEIAAWPDLIAHQGGEQLVSGDTVFYPDAEAGVGSQDPSWSPTIAPGSSPPTLCTAARAGRDELRPAPTPRPRRCCRRPWIRSPRTTRASLWSP